MQFKMKLQVFGFNSSWMVGKLPVLSIWKTRRRRKFEQLSYLPFTEHLLWTRDSSECFIYIYSFNFLTAVKDVQL